MALIVTVEVQQEVYCGCGPGPLQSRSHHFRLLVRFSCDCFSINSFAEEVVGLRQSDLPDVVKVV